ncbi:peptidoglycan-binding protein LysM [Collimonas sp. H4R21]|jgi:nucleoid-associated protein YgaU|uniref:Peptidoglycan-binding protein LysM n=1 Tax=Collimonas rhizosphaerae TaxID=3126357 RepID=A0ABU9PR80_9BURK|nr:peptidoglycan-binding protein LysM [Collimonas sp. OK412]SFC40227.1 LysM domain-containing protein [Collimonas sp. OK412]
MGLLSFFKDAGEKLLGHKPAEVAAAPNVEELQNQAADAIKAYVGTQGIDTSGLTLAFDATKSEVTVSGEAPDQATREKIILCCGNVKDVASVNSDNLKPDVDESQWYTVVSGDNLSKISKEYYGDANKYNAIFEANKPMLKSPDLIYPGQMLRIPPQ